MNKEQQKYLSENDFQLNIDEWNNKSYIQKNYHNGIYIKVFEKEKYYFGFAIAPFDFIYNEKELEKFNNVFFKAAEITNQINDLGRDDFIRYVSIVKKRNNKKG